MGSRISKPALDVGLVTANAQPLIDFYAGVAGFEVLEPLELPTIGTIHKLACGESILRVMVPVDLPKPDEGVSKGAAFSAIQGIRYLTIEVEDVDAATRAVEELGGTVTLAPFELRPGRRVAQVADPDGNMIELGQG